MIPPSRRLGRDDLGAKSCPNQIKIRYEISSSPIQKKSQPIIRKLPHATGLFEKLDQVCREYLKENEVEDYSLLVEFSQGM